MAGNLILVLGDQLTPGRGALRDACAGRDIVVMAEVGEEASYVRHNRHKIALLFSAMRHFREELEAEGFHVVYYPFEAGLQTLQDAVCKTLEEHTLESVICCEPGEHRLLDLMRAWDLPVPVEIVPDDRFLCSRDDFSDWAQGRKQLRMEYFYRKMRQRLRLLLDDEGGPEGGKWNYDSENRRGWRSQCDIPPRPQVEMDGVTTQVVELVDGAFAQHPGDLDRFNFATTRAGAEEQFAWFLQHALPAFGRYQDALAEESPWLFHSLISMYLNIGLLDPLEVCREVEARYRAGDCELAAAEGFIRQIAGWREYVRGVYWLTMPEYRQRNALDARRALPDWFWTGESDLRCLSQALGQTLDLGYAHHIQRLMVIGNFCLLTGMDVQEVCDWYLAVYVDAFEWVELPNTLGMALHADDGLMASKPYAASGKYIQRQGDHCKTCKYSPSKMTGEGACPLNSLYWGFVARHLARWKENPRMALSVRNWQKKTRQEQTAILRWAERETERLCQPSGNA